MPQPAGANLAQFFAESTKVKNCEASESSSSTVQP
jgi:hypothetical protein